jgi:hypothetical protein
LVTAGVAAQLAGHPRQMEPSSDVVGVTCSQSGGSFVKIADLHDATSNHFGGGDMASKVDCLNEQRGITPLGAKVQIDHSPKQLARVHFTAHAPEKPVKTGPCGTPCAIG